MLAQLEDLRASRARIVEAGDAARRRLERDLHDGAQQRLLALSYELRLARATPRRPATPSSQPLLGAASDEVQAALAELRELAHGIYPAILTEAGLGPALATLADAAPIPVELGDVTAERFAGCRSRRAAYVVVAEAIADAARRGAGYVGVTALRDDARLVVDIEDDGSERDHGLPTSPTVSARSAALSAIEDGTLRAEIPCA